jgi:hypothetical protein
MNIEANKIFESIVMILSVILVLSILLSLLEYACHKVQISAENQKTLGRGCTIEDLLPP